MDRLNGAVELVPAPVVQHDSHSSKAGPLGESGRVSVELIQLDAQMCVIVGVYEAWLPAKRCCPYRAISIPENKQSSAGLGLMVYHNVSL